MDLISRDWRTYFNPDELDRAFQAVEIENRDIPEEASEDGGSNSDPSDDNLEEDEIYEQVYELPQDKTEKMKKDKIASLQQLNKHSMVSGALLYSRLSRKNRVDSSKLNGQSSSKFNLGRISSGLNQGNGPNLQGDGSNQLLLGSKQQMSNQYNSFQNAKAQKAYL